DLAIAAGLEVDILRRLAVAVPGLGGVAPGLIPYRPRDRPCEVVHVCRFEALAQAVAQGFPRHALREALRVGRGERTLHHAVARDHRAAAQRSHAELGAFLERLDHDFVEG